MCYLICIFIVSTNAAKIMAVLTNAIDFVAPFLIFEDYFQYFSVLYKENLTNSIHISVTLPHISMNKIFI